MNRSDITKVMREYGQAIRGDWSGFDGRTMKAVLDDFANWVDGGELPKSIERARGELGICEAGGGHWCGLWGYCDGDCNCKGWHGRALS